MKILAFSTASKDISCALLEDEVALWEVNVNNGRHHSEMLLPTIDHILKESQLALGGIDLFACISGPGSFTGLRVGMSTAKGLAMVTGKPMIGISALEAIAFASGVVNRPVCTLMPARPEHVYYGLYRFSDESDVATIAEEKFCHISQIFEGLPEGEIMFVGEGAHLYRREIECRLERRALIVGKKEIRGSVVGILGYRNFVNGRVQNPVFAIPHYLQASKAESKVDKERLFELRR